MRRGPSKFLRWGALLALVPLVFATVPHSHHDGELQDGRCVTCQAHDAPALLRTVVEAAPAPAARRPVQTAWLPRWEAVVEGHPARGPPARA